MTEKLILAADVGGTKTDVGLFRKEAPSGPAALAEATLLSADFPDLPALLRDFLGRTGARPDLAVLGLPGPVEGGRVRLTNLPWVVDRQELRQTLDLPAVLLLNDLEALAHALPLIPENELHTLQAGRPEAGQAALIAAGTGLGEAILFWDGQEHHPLPTEGGHADFAPRSLLEAELFQYLAGIFGHVSYERVACGPGLINVYRFLVDVKKSPEPAWLRERLERGDPSAAVASAGLSGESQTCAAALDIFVRVYGAEAGNLALKCLPRGGLFLGGGIAPKIVPALTDGRFLASFLDKGRMRRILEEIPVKVILSAKPALLGAAAFGLKRLKSV